ncbi:MAG TPA: hypothetical protein VMB25_20245, partial [Bryobacteraceae bacterium]|nr:hypothetical protein [Bryobacteraceae bacterium]
MASWRQMEIYLLGLGAMGLALASNLAAQNSCDRACLEGFVDKYFDAMVAHDPHQLPLAKNVKFTENGQKLELGEGLWSSIEGKGTYRLFVTDVPAQQVAFMGTVREEGPKPGESVPRAIALRLKIDHMRIAEVETLVVINPMAGESIEKLGKPNPVFLEEVPPGERMSRADLIKTANMYFSGMQQNDG